jgi:hypothetical protein
LTVSSDKLPAIAGIAAQYGKGLNSAYLAGLWEFALLSELMWCSTRSDITRPIVQRAPSWSWVSVDGEVHHDWCAVGLGPGSPRIISCAAPPTSRSSPFGSVIPEQCMLTLEAYIGEVSWGLNRKVIYKCSDHSDEIGRSQADAIEVGRTALDTEVWALLVQEDPCRGLLLVKADENLFRRVGVFYRIWDLEAVGFERRVVSII